MNVKLQKSKNFTEEYCCSVVRVGELMPVENSDRLMQTRINGESIVVNKDDVKEGDVMLYVSNECQISDWFLSGNNLYRHHKLNHNYSEVEERIRQDADFLKSEEARKMCGYFDDNGRVRMIKLRGCPSFGVLFKPEAIGKGIRTLPHDSEPATTGGINWEEEVGTDFDTIDGTLFVKAYVPKRTANSQSHGMKGVTRWDRLDRMVPGQFRLHYDTAPLKKHLVDFSPKTVINVTVKMHGTSFICGNVLTNVPLRFFKVRRFVNRLLRHDLIRETTQKYGMVVSSRKVIRNEWANIDHPEGYFGADIWTEYAEIIYPYLPKGVTLYGEICGYVTGDAKMIQREYDYGCRPGENFLMPYRVTEHTTDGLKEYSIEEVGILTEQIKAAMHDAGDKNVGRIFNILNARVYHGTIANLLGYAGCVISSVPSDVVKELPDALANLCQIEKREPLCTNYNVPREGVVVRIDGDEVPEAFKLKSLAFLEREKKAIDRGEVDMEMSDGNQ